MTIPGKSFNKDLVLSWLLHHMSMETRFKLTNALPEAYNDIMEQEVATVVRTSDLPNIVKFT